MVNILAFFIQLADCLKKSKNTSTIEKQHGSPMAIHELPYTFTVPTKQMCKNWESIQEQYPNLFTGFYFLKLFV
jgi:hypothetical protein